MSEQTSEPQAAHDRATSQSAESVTDRLVFAALTEQRRARRWRVFFMSFFVIYLTVVTIALFHQGATATGGEADGEKHTALVRVNGVIAGGEDAGAENIIAGLRAAFKHADTAGIVLEINSPGGSPVQASYIYDEIRRLREDNAEIPVYAVVTDIAASGGYFVAAAADRIYVNRSSLVGSIGVRLDAFGFVDMMQKLGIERRLLTAGENKGLFDPFLPEQQAQRDHLQSMLDEVHRHFIEAVRQGRGDRLLENETIFSGLVWSGERSIGLGLADEFGTRHSVARELEAEDIVDFTPQSRFIDRLADRIGSSAGAQISESLLGGFRLD